MERRDRKHGRIATLQRPVVPALIVAVLALAGMAAIFLYDARIAAGGWLTALVFWGGIAIGSLFAIMIYTLTGGRWGTGFAPALIPAAMALPLIAALFAPILVELKIIYPWAYDPASTPSDVSQLYLNIPFYIARSLGALFFWTIMALLLTRLSGEAAVLTAAIGLGIHGLIIGLIGLDWILRSNPLSSRLLSAQPWRSRNSPWRLPGPRSFLLPIATIPRSRMSEDCSSPRFLGSPT